MKNKKLLLLPLLFSMLFVNSVQADTEIDLSRFFKGYQGTFVLLNQETGNIQRYNHDQSVQRLSPCSTYKIAHSLFALDIGILEDENQILKWDGKERSMKAWNSDLSLSKAIEVSAVPHFQQIAREIGQERMRAYLSKTNYGNQDTSGGIAKFWLGSTLKISAEEQVLFISKLIQNELPVSNHAVQTVKTIIKLETTDNGTLYGKTGGLTDNSGQLILGWFVGFVETKNGNFVFATNIKQGDRPGGWKAKKITKDILNYMNLL